MAWTQDHVHLRCENFDVAMRFFAENLDAKEEGRIMNGAQVRAATIRMGGTVYKVSPKLEGQTLPHGEIYHLGFETDDLVGELEKMKARGIKVTKGPELSPTQRLFAFVEGPEGITLELIQREK